MIRINLLPTKKRGSKAAAAQPAGSAGQYWVLGWLVGWTALIGVGWWVVDLKEAETEALRRKSVEATKQAETIKQEINEEALEAAKNDLAQLQAAIEKLEKKKRTPVYVMYDLATILTDPAMDATDPPVLDIDEVKLGQLLREDPKAGINLRWDPTGLWVHTIIEKSGVLAMTGSARDASDLTEFVRRLRASGRFGSVTSPDFNREARRGEDGAPRHLDWTIGAVAIRRWD